MRRCKFLALIGLVAAALLGISAPFMAADDEKADDPHAAHFGACAKACAHCMLECESCAHHCARLVISGQKDHAHTLGTCVDCAEFCASAAKIVARHGVMANLICESCAKACDTCGEACEKFPDDGHMKKCATACRDCAAACREMIKHADGGENK